MNKVKITSIGQRAQGQTSQNQKTSISIAGTYFRKSIIIFQVTTCNVPIASFQEHEEVRWWWRLYSPWLKKGRRIPEQPELTLTETSQRSEQVIRRLQSHPALPGDGRRAPYLSRDATHKQYSEQQFSDPGRCPGHHRCGPSLAKCSGQHSENATCFFNKRGTDT